MNNIIYFDAFAGVSGDMILGALIDLGYPEEKLRNSINCLNIKDYSIKIINENKRSISARRIIIDTLNHEHHHHKNYKDIKNIIESSELNQDIKNKSLEIFKIIGDAEAKIHGTDIDNIHFHEVGAIDSIIDIVGISCALDYFKCELWSSPLPLGRGFVDIEHGRLPLPAPATLEILKNVPVYGIDFDKETVTPTGAAVIASQVKNFGGLPLIRPINIGWGAGSRDHEKYPSLLRVVYGEYVIEKKDGYIVIETNIDDQNPQLVPYLTQKLLENNAIDVWLTNVLMKKGRAGFIIGILCKEFDLDNIRNILFSESSSIGLRYWSVSRFEMNRIIKIISTDYGDIPVKLIGSEENPVNISPEYEICAQIAREKKIPLKKVMQEAINKFLNSK